MDSRGASLQRNIEFLQKQHRETLEKLHGEIDILKRENKGTFMLHSLTCYRNNCLGLLMHDTFMRQLSVLLSYN